MERPKDHIGRTSPVTASAPPPSSSRLARYLGRAPWYLSRVAAARCWPRVAMVAGAVLVAVPIAIFAGTGPSAQARPSTGGGAGSVPTVNWALSGTATATTAEPGKGAADAIDGDAGTDWCTSEIGRAHV